MAVVKAVHGHESEVTGLVQVAQLQHVKAPAQGAASLLLGIEGLRVERVVLERDGARVAHVVTAGENASACPSCGVVSTSLKGYAVTHPRDVPYGLAPARLVWRKRRWRCREVACPRGSFIEALPAVPPLLTDGFMDVSSAMLGSPRACGSGIGDQVSDVLVVGADQAAGDADVSAWPGTVADGEGAARGYGDPGGGEA